VRVRRTCDGQPPISQNSRGCRDHLANRLAVILRDLWHALLDLIEQDMIDHRELLPLFSLLAITHTQLRAAGVSPFGR
jgi:hypothetical protein